MTNLKNEYIDKKDRKHNVEHVVVSNEDGNREQIIEELIIALTKSRKSISA